MATENYSPKRGQLSAGDRERVMRLYEEVFGRLTEAHLIMTRVLGQEPGIVTGMSIRARAGGEAAPEGAVLVEFHLGDDGDLCYYDPPGYCEPC